MFHKKKLVRILMTSVCLIAVFTVSVFADGWNTISNAYFDNFLYVSEGSVNEFTYRLPDTDSQSNTYAFNLSNTGVGSVVALARTGSTFRFSVKAGEVVTIDPAGDFSGWFGGPDNVISKFAWALIKFNNETNNSLPYKVLYQSGWYNVTITERTEGGCYYSVRDRTVTFTSGQNYDDVFVALLFDVDLVTGNVFSINRVTYSISWGDPVSPESPNYTGPDDGNINDYANLESELLNGSLSIGGSDSVDGLFTGFENHLVRLAAGVTGANQLFDIALGEFDFITPLIYIALTLGIFGFIFNMLPSLISSNSDAQRSSGWQKGKARQDANFIKRDGIAAHRPSRK